MITPLSMRSNKATNDSMQTLEINDGASAPAPSSPDIELGELVFSQEKKMERSKGVFSGRGGARYRTFGVDVEPLTDFMRGNMNRD
jgi:hypothetical protein